MYIGNGFRILWWIASTVFKVSSVIVWFIWSMIGAIPIAGTIIQTSIAVTLLYQTGILEAMSHMFGYSEQWDKIVIALEGFGVPSIELPKIPEITLPW